MKGKVESVVEREKVGRSIYVDCHVRIDWSFLSGVGVEIEKFREDQVWRGEEEVKGFRERDGIRPP